MRNWRILRNLNPRTRASKPRARPSNTDSRASDPRSRPSDPRRRASNPHSPASDSRSRASNLRAPPSAPHRRASAFHPPPSDPQKPSSARLTTNVNGVPSSSPRLARGTSAYLGNPCPASALLDRYSWRKSARVLPFSFFQLVHPLTVRRSPPASRIHNRAA